MHLQAQPFSLRRVSAYLQRTERLRCIDERSAELDIGGGTHGQNS
jgi:hypothetical protein